MWDKIATISTRAKVLSTLLASLLAIGGSVWAAASVVATDAEVDEKVQAVEEKLDQHIQKQVESNKQKTIQSAKTELRRINYELLDESLSPAKKAFLQQSEKELKELIQCIQAGKAFCN